MRLLQLATGPDEMLDLHPNVTVVTGLDDDGHVALVDAVTSLARAEAAEGPGLLEAHGVLFDLDPALLSVIESADSDLDPIVHPGQLPTQPVSVDARELRNREQAFAVLLELIATQAEKQSLARGAVAATATAVEEARRARADAEEGARRRTDELGRLTRRLDQLAEERRRVEQELSRVDPALSAAQAARAEVERRTAAVREAKEAGIALRSSVEAELAEVDATLHGDAAAEVERAAVALRQLEADIEAERALEAERARAAEATPATVDDLTDAEREPAPVRLARLDGRAQELDQLLTVVTPVERMAIEEALALLAGGESADLVPSAEAAALADELDRISIELGDPGEDGGDQVGEASLADARTCLDDARQALLEAEQAVRNPELDRDDVVCLEDVHDELLTAMDKAEGRFAGARAASRVVELRAAEQEVLDRLGFTSYSAYVMGYSLLSTDPEKEEALDAARAELAAAEDAWRKLEQATEAALARAAVLDRRRELLEQAREVLGRVAPGGRPQEALRALLVPAVSAHHSARLLQASLGAVGVELGDEEPDHEELALIAEAWLHEADQVDGRRRAALEERTALQAERAELLVELEAERLVGFGLEPQASEDPGAVDPEGRRLERLAEARADLAAAERRQVAAEAAEARRGGLVADLATAQEIERSAAEATAGADREMSLALAAEARLAEQARVLDEELARTDREVTEADESLRRLSDPAPDLATLDAELDAGEALHAEALAGVEVVDRALATLDAEGRAAALEIERLQDIVTAQGTGTATPAEELEWYLLARLAAQRAVSVAGSVPLLLDDALRGLDTDEVGHLLGRLERMAEAVQVIVISEDPVVASWAVAAGPARAAVVSPIAR